MSDAARSQREAVKRVRSPGAWLLGIGLLATLLAGSSPAFAGRLGLNLYGISHHFDRSAADGYQFNEANLGGGLDWVIRRGPEYTLFADVGAYRDSFRNTNRYASIAWSHALVGPLQGGLGLAIASSRTSFDGDLLMMPGPLLSLRTDRLAVHLTYAPEAIGLNGYSALATWVSVYPFGAAGVQRSEPAAQRDSSLVTGIEFTVAGDFQLEAPGGASIAFKRRLGAHGWRVTADLSGTVRDTHRWWRKPDGDETEGVNQWSLGRFHFEGRAERLSYAAEGRGPELLLGYGPLLGYDDDGRAWRVGLTGTCGVEWRLAEILSVGAEYGLDLAYTNRARYERSASGMQQVTDWSFDLMPRTVRLALTAWFD